MKSLLADHDYCGLPITFYLHRNYQVVTKEIQR